MIETYKLPHTLRMQVEKELASTEIIRWIEQPIPRWFTRSVVGTCFVLLITLLFFSFVGFTLYQQVQGIGRPLLEFPGLIGVSVFLFGTLVPFGLILYLPAASWLWARRTVYVITNKRAFILTGGQSTTTTTFVSSELRAITRREHKDGSGDIIVYTHKSKDYDGDTVTQEMGFIQIRNPKAFEKYLYQLSSG